MKNIKYILIFGTFIFIFLMTGCKSSKIIETEKINNLPESYASSKDSSSSATINWQTYFSDPNLVSLIEEGLKNNLDLLMAMQKIEVANSQVQFNKRVLLPTINGFGSAGQRKFGDYTMDWAGNKTTEITPGKIIPMHLQDYYVGLQTSWEIDVWGKMRSKKTAALARFASSIEGKNLLVTNLVSEIAISYYELLALDNQLEIIKETIQLQENALLLIQIQKQAAMVNELAVQQFQTQLLTSKSLEFETLQSITETENKINFLLGRFPQEIKRDKAMFTNNLPTQVKEGIPSELLVNRPDIRQAENELIATKADVKAAKAAFYPSVSINGALGFQAFQTRFLFSSPASIAYSLFGTLSAPLINRNAIKTEFRNANVLQQEALYNYQKTIVNGYIEVYNELARIKNLEKIVDLQSQKATMLTQSIETSTELFKTGKANYIEVLMVQNGSLESKLELINAKQQQFIATVNMYKALGGGWR